MKAATKTLADTWGARAFDSVQRKLERRDIAAAERWGEKLSRFVQRVDKKHAQRALSNLELAFPEWPLERRIEVADGMYRHFGRVFADFMQTPSRAPEKVLASEVVGLEHLEAAEAKGNGILAITGHFGSWERLGHWMTLSGRKLTVIARDANQGAVNDRVLRLREAAGMAVLSRGSAIRGALQRLRAGEMVGILADQNAYEELVPFFGKPCGTVKGPATMHERTGAPMVPMYAVWTGPGRYRIEIYPELEAVPGYERIEGLTRAMNLALEAQVRRYPEQWLWMHDRWKLGRQRGLL